MPDVPSPPSSRSVYEIRLAGQLDPLWASWFDGFQLTNLPGENRVLLCGPVTHQAELHGLLNRIRDLNLTLISVIRIYPT